MTTYRQDNDDGALAPAVLLTVRELATALHVHPNTVRIWNNRGLLRAFRLGPRRDRRFRWEDVSSFLSSHGTEFGLAAGAVALQERDAGRDVAPPLRNGHVTLT